MSSDDAALKRLEAVKAKRGYLLPHHGLMALTAPELLEGYDATYTALTLKHRTLSEHDREFVWLGVLTSKREHIAAHHLVKFLKAGGTHADVNLAVQLTALAEGSGAFSFISDHWQHHMPAYNRKSLYVDTFYKINAGSTLRIGLMHLLLAAVHGCLSHTTELQWHVKECYRLNVPEDELAEALSYIMFSGSVPTFIEACGVWQTMIKDGSVPATALFQKWAELDQSGPG
jgi:alkylhydroperoxidase/carboxymuconolactone decarboxylase family protein YurZ